MAERGRAAMTGEVPALAGFTVGVTAARRADELSAMLERRGATVRRAPAIRIEPLADDSELLTATRRLLDGPVDVVVATTGMGFRGWLEAAEGWGLGPDLLHRLGSATVLARGPKAIGAVRAAGLVEAWAPASESTAEILDHLLAAGVGGRRVAVQLHGEALPQLVTGLRGAGAEVVEIPVYRWSVPADQGPLDRLLDGVLAGRVDALTFTSAPAAANLLATADRSSRLGPLLAELRSRVLVACVGSVTAAPLLAADVPVVRPDRARIGGLVRTVADALPARAARIRINARDLELRGHAVVLDGELREVSPAPMAVLRALAATPGRVVGRAALVEVLQHQSGRRSRVEAHAVESAVGRLRAALGDPALVRTVVKRGYRLAVDPRRSG